MGNSWSRVTICHIRSPLMNLTGCEIRFVLLGQGRVTEWSLTSRLHGLPILSMNAWHALSARLGAFESEGAIV